MHVKLLIYSFRIPSVAMQYICFPNTIVVDFMQSEQKYVSNFIDLDRAMVKKMHKSFENDTILLTQVLFLHFLLFTLVAEVKKQKIAFALPDRHPRYAYNEIKVLSKATICIKLLFDIFHRLFTTKFVLLYTLAIQEYTTFVRM